MKTFTEIQLKKKHTLEPQYDSFREHKNVQLSSSKAMLHSCSKTWASNTLKFETILSFGELMAKMDADKL